MPGVLGLIKRQECSTVFSPEPDSQKVHKQVAAVASKAIPSCLESLGSPMTQSAKFCCYVGLVSLEKTQKLLKETFKVSVVAVSIFMLTSYRAPASFGVLFIAPVFEEIIFRGFVQTSLEYAHYGYNQIRQRCFKKEVCNADLQTQKKMRVMITAGLFAAAHLNNTHKRFLNKLIQVTFCFVFGLSAGYLKEKTQSVAFGIFYHFISNVIATEAASVSVMVLIPIFAYIIEIASLACDLESAINLAFALTLICLYSSVAALILLLDWAVYRYSTQDTVAVASH